LNYLANPFVAQRHIYDADIKLPWLPTSKLPFGFNVRSVGEMGTIQAETDTLLRAQGIDQRVFSNEVLRSLKEILDPSIDLTGMHQSTWTIPAEEIEKRKDLRSYRIFTIDPTNGKCIRIGNV
jgi:protein SSD1